MGSEQPREGREFAVLVPVVAVGGADHILFTKRPERPEDHYSGQICFPGGAREAVDTTLAECALRETREELGVPGSRVEIFAELGWHRTSIHDRVKPFAGRFAPGLPLRLNPDEVEKVLFLPVSRLSRELFELRGIWQGPDGEEHRILRFDLEGHEVWGLTARILHDFWVESAEFRAEATRGGATD
ncbi:MAG: CoA pyrophosphatase [Planctomycetota bacterium]|nr:CoA pyrophosphatase [Planctomycetota bacterium]